MVKSFRRPMMAVDTSGLATKAQLDQVASSVATMEAGSPANTLIGTVVVGQSTGIVLALGIRELSVALAGAVVGARYQAFARSYTLNGGSSVNGRPPGYTILDCTCNTAGQVIVSLNAPLLAIGASYAITCDIVRVNT